MSIACPALIADVAPGLCRAVDVYCERTSAAFDAEPVNALTNLAYFAAAFFAWRLSRRRPNQAAAGLVAALILAIVAIGVGSFLFHTIATAWASWADIIPILVFMLLFLWVSLRRFFGWPAWISAVSLAIFLAVTVSAEAFVPERILWGGAYAAPTLVVLIVAGAALAVRRSPAGSAMLAAALLFLASFTFRTLDMPLCGIWPVGLHFMWHLLNATLLFLLVRAAILYAPQAPTHDGY